MSVRNSAPAPPPPPTTKKTSTLKKVIYAIIILVALSLILQALGVGVMSRRENDTMIERPHAE